jgi:hypothetical protein
MLLDADDLADALVALAEHNGIRGGWDASIIRAARADAERLAHRTQDEPAAFFVACARRSLAFGKLAEDFVPAVARAQAVAIGFALELTDLELTILRLRILRHEISFDELCDLFVERLRPLGTNPGG